MKWIIILLVAAIGCWAYFNVDFSNLNSQADQNLRQEKTLKKFFSADEQNKKETQDVLNNF
ncbi:MAG: hypothetical protein K6C94_08000 [Candidatus Gastranaerophilales bacterium]|nr:hypothetical protein [Candidatus Gastranaerophilales bacterium]